MSFFTANVTREVEITDSETGVVAHVTIKKFSEGDIQRRTDTMSLFFKDGVADMKVALGALRKFDLETAVVGWDIEGVPFEAEKLSDMDPVITEVIYAEVQKFNPSVYASEEAPLKDTPAEKPMKKR